MVDVLVLEDEQYTRKFIKKLVSQNPLIRKVFDTSRGSEAVDLAQKFKPDIFLVDIELDADEELNGIEVAKIIFNLNPETFFVFITGYSKYAIESFAVHPYDYILKPFNKDKILNVISSLAGKVCRSKKKFNSFKKLKIKSGNEVIFIKSNDIIFIEKHKKIAYIHTKKGIFKIAKPLKEFEQLLGPNFKRVHKSYIANLAKISRVKEVSRRSYEILFEGYDKTALMSRYKYEDHRKIFTPSD